MKLKMFSIYDQKVQVFNTPFFMVNQQIAKRAFSDLMQEEGTTINKHPKDFALYELGEYDDSTGKLDNHPVAVMLLINEEE
ncbi:nonstructural protein [Microviridae sp.]|nr:nonstructural protein [Microviridae sp.]